MASNLALAAKILFETDRKAIEAASAALIKTKGHIGNVEKASLKVDAAFNKIVETLDNMENAANSFGQAAQGILEPLTQAQDAYIQRVGATEEASASWLKTTERIAQAQMRLGKVASQALQPMQDRIAKIVDTAADFIEKHPEILDIAAGVGGTLLAAQTVLMIATQAKSVISSIGGGLSGLGISGAGLAGAGIGAAAGVGLGFGVSKLIGVATGRKDLQKEDFNEYLDRLKTTLAQLLLIVGKLLNQFKETIADIFGKLIAGLTDWYNGLVGLKTNAAGEHEQSMTALRKEDDEALKDFAEVLGLIPSAVEPLKQVFGEQDLQRYAMFLKQREQEQEQFNLQLTQMDEQYQRQKLAQEAEFERQSLQQQRDFAYQQQQEADNFNRELSQSDADHRREAALAQADFNRQSARAEEDFRLQQIRAQEDHYRNIQDAAARLDALAVLQEQRDYATNSTRAQQDHALEVKRQKEEFKVQQKLQEDNYKWQRQRMIDNFRYQQQQAAANFRRDQDRQRAEFNNQMRVQEQEYQFQRNQQIAQFNLQRQLQADQYQYELQQQANFYNMSASQLANYYNNLRNQLNAFISGGTISGGSTTGGTGSGSGSVSYAEGGYMNAGLSRTHDGEYALTNATTKMLEGMAGGRLTQSRVIAMARGGMGSMSNVMNFYGVGEKSPAQLEAEIQSAMVKVFRDYNEGNLN